MNTNFVIQGKLLATGYFDINNSCRGKQEKFINEG